MENSWRRNSESMWQQSATTSFAASASHDRNLFSPADQHFSLQRPQKRMIVTHGMIQEDMVPHMRGSNNMVSADLGASYLSLLSGPLAQLPHDLQNLSNQKPMHMSSQVSFNEMIASGFSAESRVPLLPGALYPQNIGRQNGKFGEIVLQLTSSSSTDGVYHGNSSMQLQDANSNFRKLQTVGRQNSHGNEKPKDFSSLFGSNNAGAISHSSWKVQDYSEITTLLRDPSCINFSAHNHGRNPGSYLPHVFCSGISGKLLLTDTGLLGVVCLCHGLYMSISKFLEHSGSYDDNPGNAIYMDTGDTLAHWCKTFFSETGIRVLEGHRVWDWPEGISAGSSLTNHPKSSVSNNTVLLNQVGPTRTSVSCGQQPCIAMNSKENHSCSNIVDGFICHEKEKTLQECSNSLFKDFISSSSGNLHYAADQQRKGMLNSVGDNNIEKSSHSTRTKVNSTCESSNVLFPFPDIQNLQALRNVFSDSRNPNSLMEGLGISSNIELRLGQPTEPSQTPKTKVSPAFGSILDGVSVESQKVFMDHLPQKSRKFEALQATLQFADIASGSCEGRGTTQSEHPNHVGGAFGAITDYPTGSFSHVMEMTDQNPLSLSYFRNPESRGHLTTTNYMGNANHVEQQMHSEDASKSDQLCFPWSEATGIGSKISNAQNHVDKEKEVESTVNGLFGARELDLKFSNILMEDLSTSNVDLGKSSYSYYPGSRVKKPMSAIIANKSQDRDILNNSWKSAPLNINHVKYGETMTMAFSSKTSASVPCKTSIWPKDKGSRINSGFRDVSLKMTAARSMSESSNRDTAPASDDARVPCQLSCNLHPMEQHPPSAKEQCSQILQHVCAPEKWSSAVPPKNLIEKYVLNNDTCNLVKDKDRSANGVFTSLFHDKSCICAEAIAKPFEISETLGSKNMKRDESQYFQWRDVPRKLTASCSRARKDHQAGSESINGNLRSPASDAAKCFTRSVQTVVSLKENEISYASSSLSGPEVTQASIGIKKIDRNVRCTNNLVLDEGSRNDKSWSSVDAREKENCTEPFDSVSNIGLTERRSLQEVGKEPFPSLFEELRLLDSLKPKHKKYQYHRNSTFQEGRDNLQMTELISKKRKKIEWMKPDPSFTVSGLSSVSKGSPKCSEEVGQNASSVWDMQRSVEWDEVSPKNCEDSVEESFKQRISALSAYKDISLNRDLNRVHHRQLQTAEEQKIARFDGDNLAAPEIFRTKRLKVNCACASSEQIQQMRCNDVGLAEKNISVDRLCSGPMNFYKWMARPIVSGKYGIISNGNLSKPVKVLPLRHILKKVVHHAERSNISLAYSYGNDKVKFTSAKIIKKSVGNVKEISRDEKGLHGEVKASAMLDVVSIELKHHEPSGVTETESCSASKGCNDLSCKGSGKCKTNHFITDKKGRDRLTTKFKEPRNRSIHELLIKGKGSTTRYQGELTNEPANDEVQTNELNNAKRNLERPRHKKLNVLCCGCGGPNKDKYNQVRECKRCSPKGLLHSEDKAVDLAICKRGMVHAPSLSLQAGENFLTCARTEGYKGRKREGFWHNHVQESKCNAACLVPQEQLNAWLHIHRRKLHRKGRPKLPSSNVDSNCRKAYARYKQLKEWKHLVVYKSGIHALGLYTSQFISCGAMVVEYVGEIVGLRVADKREREYHSGKKVQHKSACYFFRIDKEHIIDATRKGGIARFVNHSCLPNCAAKVISVRNEKKVVFLAERDIYPGEEITYDYHFNHEDEGEKIACYCNSKNCRRYLN